MIGKAVAGAKDVFSAEGIGAIVAIGGVFLALTWLGFGFNSVASKLPTAPTQRTG